MASPPFPKSLADGLYWLEKLTKDAASAQAEIICFPESYLSGYPGMEYPAEDRSPEKLQQALERVCQIAVRYSIAIIAPMDWHFSGGLLNLAYVVSAKGEVLRISKTKNQLDPTEDKFLDSGTERSLFEVNGIKFGITICHEGFRYPESVRWAARRGAKIVFFPHFNGNNTEGVELTEWGSKNNPIMRRL